jgi:methylated-DNA-[protein]-cysteine S-methyltransferase
MAGVSHDQVRRLLVPTVLGTFVVDYTLRGICGLGFPAPARKPVRTLVPDVPPFLRRLTSQLQAYAEGQPASFDFPLDLSSGTLFQQKVWHALGGIPHGQTRSYAWVARKMGRPKAARAVGAACGANPVPIIIPCHRVIASDGSLGGFSGGLRWKKRLLGLERPKNPSA